MADIKKIRLGDNTYNIVDASAVHTVDSALSDSSTNPVQNKVVKAECDNIREVAEGKCKTYTLRVDSASADSRNYQSLQKYDGTKFKSAAEVTAYIGSLSYQNASFNSSNDIFYTGYIIVNDNTTMGTILKHADNALKNGDIILVTATEVPDRWYDSSSHKFNKLETSKVDLGWSQIGTASDPKPTTISGYGITDAYTKTEIDTSLSGKANDNAVVHLAGNETISGVKNFSNGIQVGGVSLSGAQLTKLLALLETMEAK